MARGDFCSFSKLPMQLRFWRRKGRAEVGWLGAISASTPIRLTKLTAAADFSRRFCPITDTPEKTKPLSATG